MYKPSSPEDFIAHAPETYRPGLIFMREVLLATGMEEAIKWNMPVYGFGRKNIAMLFYARNYLGVWFSQGALLADPNGVLVNASPDKTVAQRQLRFADAASVDLELLREFIGEAILNHQAGLEFLPVSRGELEIPAVLQLALDEDAALAAAFARFPLYQQREFCNSINQVKRAATKARKVEQAREMIMAGLSYTEKYRTKK